MKSDDLFELGDMTDLASVVRRRASVVRLCHPQADFLRELRIKNPQGRTTQFVLRHTNPKRQRGRTLQWTLISARFGALALAGA